MIHTGVTVAYAGGVHTLEGISGMSLQLRSTLNVLYVNGVFLYVEDRHAV